MSDRLNEIDDELMRLRLEYDRVEGTPTEVYTRIVGYYRAVKNWNPGKKAEYPERVMFEVRDLPEITGKLVNNAPTGDNTLPFGIQFNEELTKTRIA